VSIPFNQKALPEHLGYFTVTGSFLNLLAQVPGQGSFPTTGIRKNYVTNPSPVSTAGWDASVGLLAYEDEWFGGVLDIGQLLATPYVFTDVSEKAYVTGDKVTLSVEYVVDDAGSASHITVFPHVRTGNVYHRLGAEVTRPAVVGSPEKVVIQWTVPNNIAAKNLELAIVPTDASSNFTPQTSGFALRARRLLIEDGLTEGSWFSGSSISSEFVKYVWEGPADNSISVATSLSPIFSPGRIQMRPIEGTVVFKPTITTPITDTTTGLTLVPTSITAHIDPDGRLISPGDGKSSVPVVYDPAVRLLAPNQEILSSVDWGWNVEVIPADGSYWRGFKMYLGSEVSPGDMITLNESLVVDRDTALRPERVFIVEDTSPPYPFGFDPERDSLLVVPTLAYWRVTA